MRSLRSLTLLLLIPACADVENPDEHDHDHDHGLVTTIELVFTPDGGGEALSFLWADPQDDGDPSIDTVVLSEGSYALDVRFTNELAEPPEDVTAEVAEEGFRQAASRGDRLPQQGLAEVLKQLGRPVPEVEQASAGGPDAGAGGFVCQRTGRPGQQLPKPPFKGPIGQWIYENISAQTWRDWIGQGTKVINELRLDFSREEDQATYDQHMREFLGIDDELCRSLTGEAASGA